MQVQANQAFEILDFQDDCKMSKQMHGFLNITSDLCWHTYQGNQIRTFSFS